MRPLCLVLAALLAAPPLPAFAAPKERAPAEPKSSGTLAQASAMKLKIEEATTSTGPVSVAVSAQSMPPFGPPPFNMKEHQDLDLIQTLNLLDQQRLQQRLHATVSERDEAALRYSAGFEKMKLELWPLEMELKKLQLSAQVRDEKAKAELAPLKDQQDRLKLENDIARERLASEQIKADEAKLKMDVAMREMDFESRKLKMESELAEHKAASLKTDLELREKKESWKKEANREPEYPLQPFKDGVLTVSDRRVTLDGPIVRGTADYVTERIHYFNNKDETLPIFIVINKSPGGSVMEGYRIVKAIRASKAPVHVVVKSFAASMAAVITTLAPHSYAYPNAIILHHQLLTISWGNVTQLKEQLEQTKEWYRRLAEPVAQKMGLSVDQFTKEMYKHNSDGDWEEFADRAAELKWVDHIVHEIRETGMVKEPEDKPGDKALVMLGLSEQLDSQGKAYVRLPRLDPVDAYWIHNPDNYYR